MRTIRTKIYKFDELSNEAKENAIERIRSNREIFLDLFNEYCIEEAKEQGFEDIKLQYSLNYCQGDGLSFSAKNFTKLEELYLEVLGQGKEKTAKLLSENTSVYITGNTGFYCYASKSDIELNIYTFSVTDLKNVFNVLLQVEELLQDKYYSLCKQLENYGYEDIEYQRSDEAIIEEIEANEYEFLKDGTRYI